MKLRTRRIRKVLNPPLVKGFKPYGLDSEKQKAEPVILLYEEYEALRLCDYDMCNHIQASEIMNVSRPTFTRIYASARKKLVKAIIEGRQFSIEGGKVYFDTEWFSCNGCGCWFNHPAKDMEIRNCALCGSTEIEQFNENSELNSVEYFCICPNCGREKVHSPGIPCKNEICPDCKCNMIRKGSSHHH